MDGDLILAGEHTIQYTDGVLENCTLKTHIMLVTNIIPINSVKIKKKIKMSTQPPEPGRI